MMIAVALAAVMIGGWELNRRREHYLELATFFDERVTKERIAELVHKEMISRQSEVERILAEGRSKANVNVGKEITTGLTILLNHTRKQLAWASQLRDKFRRAASRPWLAVEADPLEPSFEQGEPDEAS
jgi:hypothetical protein